jgi:endonuclease-3
VQKPGAVVQQDTKAEGHAAQPRPGSDGAAGKFGADASAWSHRSEAGPRRTGAIWGKPPKARAKIVRHVCETLEQRYGRPTLGNPEAPLDDLVYIILSNKSSPATAERIYRSLKSQYTSWGQLLDSPHTKLLELLRPAGLASVKSEQIRSALGKVRGDFGRCDLSQLSGRPEQEVFNYLTSLPGVSDKVAKCVMMYTLGARVLPVDSHVHRVATRLGWTKWKRADQCHEELESIVPKKRRYAFHVDCIAHGRTLCRPTNPACDRCPIQQYCEHFKSLTCNAQKDL